MADTGAPLSHTAQSGALRSCALVVAFFLLCTVACHSDASDDSQSAVTAGDDSQSAVTAALVAEGLTGEYVEDEAFAFVTSLIDDPGATASDLAKGAANLLLWVLNDDVSLEHKVEILGATFVPFWGCVRPIVEGSLSNPTGIDLSQLDLPTCEREALQIFLTAAAGHLVGNAGRLAGMTAENILTLEATTNRLISWTDAVYRSGIDPGQPLALQGNRFGGLGEYRLFAQPSYFENGRIDPSRFLVNRFSNQLRPAAAPQFDLAATQALLERIREQRERYVQVTDEDGLMAIDVPTTWTIELSLLRVLAAPDIDGFHDYSGPGVLYDLWEIGPEDTFEDFIAAELDVCDRQLPVRGYDDGLFVGYQGRGHDCGQPGTSLLVVAAVPDVSEYDGLIATVVVQSTTSGDTSTELEDRFLASFTVY